jgi:hypothetical protein
MQALQTFNVQAPTQKQLVFSANQLKFTKSNVSITNSTLIRLTTVPYNSIFGVSYNKSLCQPFSIESAVSLDLFSDSPSEFVAVHSFLCKKSPKYNVVVIKASSLHESAQIIDLIKKYAGLTRQDGTTIHHTYTKDLQNYSKSSLIRLVERKLPFRFIIQRFIP